MSEGGWLKAEEERRKRELTNDFDLNQQDKFTTSVQDRSGKKLGSILFDIVASCVTLSLIPVVKEEQGLDAYFKKQARFKKKTQFFFDIEFITNKFWEVRHSTSLQHVLQFSCLKKRRREQDKRNCD